MTPSSAMIFAAGFGTRMRPLTDTRPKPLIEVAGIALLDHALNLTGELNLKTVVNAHYRADQIGAHLQDHPTATVVNETPDILDTGGGLKNALPWLGPDPVFALNSDAVWAGPNPLRILASHWQPDQMDALLLLVPLERTTGYTRPGSFSLDAQGRLQKDSDGMAYTGAQILRTDGLAQITQTAFSLWKLWDAALQSGRAYGTVYPGRWADVGTPAGISLAEDMLRQSDV